MNENEPDIQPKLTGPAHVLAAASYSLGGIRVLWREQAFRHEILGAAIIFALHISLGVRMWWIVLQIVLVAMLFTAEALNTAIRYFRTAPVADATDVPRERRHRQRPPKESVTEAVRQGVLPT